MKTIVIAIVGRAITIQRTIQKISYESKYTTKQTNHEAKRSRATTFAITKWGEKEKTNIAIL